MPQVISAAMSFRSFTNPEHCAGPSNVKVVSGDPVGRSHTLTILSHDTNVVLVGADRRIAKRIRAGFDCIDARSHALIAPSSQPDTASFPSGVPLHSLLARCGPYIL